MSYKYRYTDTLCILNFSEEYPTTPKKMIESDAFKALLTRYIAYIKVHKYSLYSYFSKASMEDDEHLVKDLLSLAKLLLILTPEEISSNNKKFSHYLKDSERMLKFVEGIYNYWRHYQRYCIIKGMSNVEGLADSTFVDAQFDFQALILATYRHYETTLGYKNLVYRQIVAGVNAAFSLAKSQSELPEEYSELCKVPIIEKVTIHPPFITNSKRHKRSGLFEEVYSNPIEGKEFDPDDWFCYPAKVGDLLIFVYFNIDMMGLGSTLCNMFELADTEDYLNKKPDLIYVCGYDDGDKKQIYWHDKDNDIFFGYLSLNDDFDYFGYMKKMILTLHNVKKIDDGQLPIHGAMIEVKFINGSQKNIVIMGDSGAGKSETIEQIKSVGEGEIAQIKTIYDDMGVLSFAEDGSVVTSGTETGAFVRLNDLDTGYGYKELDRSVFMNPDKINARIAIPITQWRDVVKKYGIDLFLYANNYDEDGNTIEFFDDKDSALEVFREGKRMSKGTTSEMGISTSFFANPFGPVQRREQTEELLQKYFGKMFDLGVKVGQIRTRLGVPGMGHNGPKMAAEEIMKLCS